MKRAFIGLSKVTLEHLKKSAHYSVTFLFLTLLATNAPAESTNVKIMMDWVIGSTHAPFFIAQDKGYYKANGVTVDSIDAGRGATNVAAHGRAASFAVIARREGKAERHIRLLAPLAFVSPRIVSALLDGTAPADLTLTKLARALPYCWAEQERRVGTSAPFHC